MLRPYPMKDGPPIPWFIAEAIHRHLYRFSQTLERMAERGGFAWSEVEYLGKKNSTGEQRAACDKQVREGFAALSFVRQRAGEGEEDKDSPEGGERYETPEEAEWVQPVEEGYKMACCDCGLVHRMDFRVEDGRAQFRAFRANRSTAMMRRHRKARAARQPDRKDQDE